MTAPGTHRVRPAGAHRDRGRARRPKRPRRGPLLERARARVWQAVRGPAWNPPWWQSPRLNSALQMIALWVFAAAATALLCGPDAQAFANR